MEEKIQNREELEDFVDFILKDVNSNILKTYIEEHRDKINKIKEIVNNDKISGIEAKMIIKDILGDD